jgi:hypothetical protein
MKLRPIIAFVDKHTILLTTVWIVAWLAFIWFMWPAGHHHGR